MIPKKIHYCWFGRNPLPELAKTCIESWKKYCPDYEIVEWNEDNFDVDCIAYTREAYDARKWAFVTDYVRLYILYNEGGIYMDTDVEVLKNIDLFLQNKGFSGFERYDSIPTGIMAAEKGHLFIETLLHDYKDRHFVDGDGNFDLTTNVVSITNLVKRNGVVLDNTKQTIMDFTFYPKDFFCPKDSRTLEVKLTENTYTIHHFDGSWDKDRKKLRKYIKSHTPFFVKKIIVWIMDRLNYK